MAVGISTLLSGEGICSSKLLDDVRSAVAKLQTKLDAAGVEVQDALIRQMITARVPEAQELAANTSISTAELCERVLAFRGDLKGGIERIVMREKARLHLRLAQGKPEIPQNTNEVFALWDEATRQEPSIRLRISDARWRVESDGLPFTYTDRAEIFGTKPLDPGCETADPEDIPEFMGQLLAFCKRDDIPLELIAVRSLLAFELIHPFVDGNGHAGRLLTYSILARASYPEPMLLAYVDAIRTYRDEIHESIVAIVLEKQEASSFDELQLQLLLEACEDAQAQLGATNSEANFS